MLKQHQRQREDLENRIRARKESLEAAVRCLVSILYAFSCCEALCFLYVHLIFVVY